MVSGDKNAKGHIDLEATETYIRDSMHRLGSIFLEKLLNSDNGGFQGKTIPCKNKKGHGSHKYKYKDLRDKGLLTVLGPVTVKRALSRGLENAQKVCVIGDGATSVAAPYLTKSAISFMIMLY